MQFLEKMKKLYRSDSFWAGLLRDVFFVIAVVVVFSSVSHIVFGLWTPMVAVESGSMIPHIQIGDIILVEGADRKEVITYMEGKQSNYTSFDNYGDVILYRPYGREEVTPIIHRAMYYIEKGEPMWNGGPPAPHAGYITKGDNPKTNPSFDQQGSISYLQPVKKEWVIGAARFTRVPVLGCISLIPRGNLACLNG
ncbi:MAG: S26 family signal peptidase [Euryarchaeota archaeon]|nr:S26 family signal peptidase [Euryarchaeota archaeon]MBU4138900.1 S26 family signal peptidase [Euryarchaeota archaeon]